MKIYPRYFALSLLIFSSALCHAALQNGKIQVSITKGESSLINPQSIKEPVVKGKLFEQGYKVETKKDSTVELCLSNGSTILVNPETLLEIRTFRQVASSLIVEGAYQQLDKEPSPSVVEILVVKGKIIGEVRKLNPQSSFTIKSPAGVARIRGTVYSVEYSRNETTRTGNMEVACVKGSVEVTVNGSDSGSQAVEPGKKMTAQTPLVDSPEDSKRVPAVAVKIVIPAAVTNSPQLSLPSTEGLVVGGEVKAPGIPSGVTVVSIENGKVTFSEPVTLVAGAEIVIDPPAGATYQPSDEKEKSKKTIVSEPVVGKNTIKMSSTAGIEPGMKLRAEGFPGDVVVVSVDPVTATVTVSVPVTVNAGTEVSTVTDKSKTQVVAELVVSKNVVKMEDVTGLRPGMKVTSYETETTTENRTYTNIFPDDVEIVSVDAVNNTVTLSVPVTLNKKSRLVPVYEPALPSPFTNPTITFSKLGQEEVKTIADDLSKGTSLPTALKEQVNNIADKTPPSVPTTPKDGTTPEKTDTPTETPTTPPPTNTGGSTNTGGVSDVMDAINKTIQETIERDNQKNPSPTQ
ncbi:MAG: FecR family protein [Opitutae bacterium]